MPVCPRIMESEVKVREKERGKVTRHDAGLLSHQDVVGRMFGDR